MTFNRALLFALVFATVAAFSQSDARNRGSGLSAAQLALFESRDFHGMPYRLLLPENYDPSKAYPLILNLHGRAGIGDDNVSQLRNWSAVFTTAKWRANYPCIMVAPQSWDSWSVFNERYPKITPADIAALPAAWRERFEENRYTEDYVSTGSLSMAFLLLDEIAREYAIDTDRVYVLGHSMGGFGSWNAIWADPDRFAAAIPSAGGLLPWKDARRFREVPVWAFHGDADPTVPFEFTQAIFERLTDLKGNMKLTTLGGVKHNAANFGFVYEGDDSDKRWITDNSSNRCDNTPDVWEWLFRQTRASRK